VSWARCLHAAVTGQAEDLVVEDLVFRSVVLASSHLLAHGIAHSIGSALTQRTGGGFNPGSFAPLGMAGGHGVKGAELGHLQRKQGVSNSNNGGCVRGGGAERRAHLVNIETRKAREVQPAVKEHGAMAGAENESVAVDPGAVVGIEVHSMTVKH